MEIKREVINGNKHKTHYGRMVDIMINATNWKELKKQLRPLQGKAIFELERHSSLNDGKFLRVLHQVKAHELVFYDGNKTSTLTIAEDMEKELKFFENGFSFLNCTYTLKQIMEG